MSKTTSIRYSGLLVSASCVTSLIPPSPNFMGEGENVSKNIEIEFYCQVSQHFHRSAGSFRFQTNDLL